MVETKSVGKVTVGIEQELWRQFRIACLHLQTTASAEITRLITERLRGLNAPQKKKP